MARHSTPDDHSPYKNKVYLSLRRARSDAGVSYNQVAAETRFAVRSLRSWENGERIPSAVGYLELMAYYRAAAEKRVKIDLSFLDGLG